MNGRFIHGFTLAEVLLGIVLFGLFAATLFPALSALDKLQQVGRQSGRRASVVSLQEQLIARGLNPATVELGRLPGITPVGDPCYAIDRSAWLARPGRVSVWKIQGEAAVAHRMLAYGFQVGAGTNSLARAAVSPPLPPILMSEPTLNPAGPDLDVSSFSVAPSSASEAWRIHISTTGEPSARVKIRFFGSRLVSGEGAATASLDLSLTELATGGTVETWTEYAGGASDVSEILADGRTRWWVSSAGSTQLYEPSNKLTQSYRVNLGAPVLLIGSTAFRSESTVPFDLRLRKTATSLGAQIRFSDDALVKFGPAAPLWSYDIFLDAKPGPSSGDVSGYFLPSASTYWSDPSVLTAKPVGGATGLAVSTGVWRLAISATKLAPPEFVNDYPEDFTEPGPHTFLAPVLDGVRVGRVRSGILESTGSTLTVDVTPAN